MKFRPYQKLINSEIIEKFKTKNLLVCATAMGGGKSLIISETARYYSNLQKKVIVLTNISELIPQIEEYLQIFDLKYKVIKSEHELNTIENDSSINIWLIMEQSFHKNKRIKLNLNADILIKDEYHIGEGKKRYEDIVASLKPKKILGLSGTPYDENGYLLNNLTEEDLILHGNAKELTDLGFLVPLEYYSAKWSEKKKYDKVKKSGVDYSTNDLDKIVNTEEHTKLTIESMEFLKGKKYKTLVYANSINHADTLTKELIKNGYKAVSIHSKKDKKENEKNLKLFDLPKNQKESVNCLVSVSKLTTGFNKPDAEFLVLCRPTKILRLYLQIIFRVARTNGKKEKGIILDLAQCVANHGFGTEQRSFIKRGERKSLTKEKEKFERKVIEHIVKENPTKITLKEVEAKVQEIRIKSFNIKELKTNELNTLFNSSIDFETILEIAFEMKYRIHKKKYEKENIKTLFKSLNLNENIEVTEKIKILKKLKEQLKIYVKEKKELLNLKF